MKHKPERTCIGCRGLFPKNQVVRIVAGPEGPVLDYREKLPGRAAYICPSRECMEKALMRDNLSRALRVKVRPTAAEDLISVLVGNIIGKIKSLIAMSAKAGKLAAGYSAVQDALEKGRVSMLIYASDISDGTKKKLTALKAADGLRHATLFTREEFGRMLNREFVGVIALIDAGLADAVFKESERLNSLINNN